MLYQLSYCPRLGWTRLPAARDGSTGGPSATRGEDCQRVSLWSVCLRSLLQYFFISSRSRSLIFDFIVM